MHGNNKVVDDTPCALTMLIEGREAFVLMMAVFGRDTDQLSSLCLFSVVHLLFRFALRFEVFLFYCSMYFYINKIRKRKKENVPRLPVPPADVNFSCTRHSLSSCLHAEGTR
jgi:hypothetical protein